VAVVAMRRRVTVAIHGGRLSPNPIRALAWHVVLGAAAGGVSDLVHPAPLAVATWMRFGAIVALPVASGGALVAWDSARGRIGEGIGGGEERLRRQPGGRAAFWAGAAFGAGYALVRLSVGLLLRR
jgi:hypothetical protein